MHFMEALVWVFLNFMCLSSACVFIAGFDGGFRCLEKVEARE